MEEVKELIRFEPVRVKIIAAAGYRPDGYETATIDHRRYFLEPRKKAFERGAAL